MVLRKIPLATIVEWVDRTHGFQDRAPVVYEAYFCLAFGSGLGRTRFVLEARCIGGPRPDEDVEDELHRLLGLAPRDPRS